MPTLSLNFGKFANVPIEQLPTHYCAWCLKNVQELDAITVEALRTRLGLAAVPESQQNRLTIDSRKTILRRMERSLSVDFPENVVKSAKGVLAKILEDLELEQAAK